MKGETVNAKTRDQRFHELHAIALTSRRMLEAVYAISFNRYPPAEMPDAEVIEAILDAEFPPAADHSQR